MMGVLTITKYRHSFLITSTCTNTNTDPVGVCVNVCVWKQVGQPALEETAYVIVRWIKASDMRTICPKTVYDTNTHAHTQPHTHRVKMHACIQTSRKCILKLNIHILLLCTLGSVYSMCRFVSFQETTPPD